MSDEDGKRKLCLHVPACAGGERGIQGPLCADNLAVPHAQRPHTCPQTHRLSRKLVVQSPDLDPAPMCVYRSVYLSEEASATPASSSTAPGCSAQWPFLVIWMEATRKYPRTPQLYEAHDLVPMVETFALHLLFFLQALSLLGGSRAAPGLGLGLLPARGERGRGRRPAVLGRGSLAAFTQLDGIFLFFFPFKPVQSCWQGWSFRPDCRCPKYLCSGLRRPGLKECSWSPD